MRVHPTVSACHCRAGSAAAVPGSRGQALVVGAGPAGVVAAMFLARQGFGVEVVERRGDPTAPEAQEANKQTFIMALMPRGTAPLRNVRVAQLRDGAHQSVVSASERSSLCLGGCRQSCLPCAKHLQ